MAKAAIIHKVIVAIENLRPVGFVLSMSLTFRSGLAHFFVVGSGVLFEISTWRPKGKVSLSCVPGAARRFRIRLRAEIPFSPDDSNEMGPFSEGLGWSIQNLNLPEQVSFF